MAIALFLAYILVTAAIAVRLPRLYAFARLHEFPEDVMSARFVWPITFVGCPGFAIFTLVCIFLPVRDDLLVVVTTAAAIFYVCCAIEYILYIRTKRQLSSNTV